MIITNGLKTLKLKQENYANTVGKAVLFLKKGETIVLPTDTIYGLACDALNEKAVEKLFKIKERDRQKGLPIFVNSIEMARRLAYIDKKKEGFLRKIWLAPLEVNRETLLKNNARRQSNSLSDGVDSNDSAGLLTGLGKITVILQAKDIIPRLTTGGRDTIALRMPNHKFVLELITAFGKPITGTSANISGNEPIRSAKEAANQWPRDKSGPGLIIDGGKIENGEPSTIVDITNQSPVILRTGIITKKELDELLKNN